MENPEQPHIAICVGTLNRQEFLATTLRSLARQKAPNNTDISILVIDNNGEGSSRDVVQSLMNECDFPVHYVIEEARGIVHMRNCALKESTSLGVTHLAFIDDDEIAEPDWISTLFEGLLKYGAQVVQGTTLREIPQETSKWLTKFGLLQLNAHPTGEIRTSAGTRNVLFDLKYMNEIGNEFNPALNLMGSSDTFFFQEAHKKGAKIVWIDEARVTEVLPKSRISAKWVIQRSFRLGVTDLEMKKLSRQFGQIVIGLFSHLILLLIFLPLSIVTLLFSRALSLKFFLNVAKASGFIHRLLGFEFLEYKKTHGN